MKKLFKKASYFIMLNALFLVACTKSDVLPDSTNTSNSQGKNLMLSDSQLIEIIQGDNLNFSRLEEIEDVLIDNSKLNSIVIRAMIDETRIPNYMVETVMILSAPISNSDLAYLVSSRPNLSNSSIVAAANIDLNHSNFAIVNTSPRQMLFAKSMVKTSICEDGCGEGEIKGENFVVLDLTSSTTPLDPTEMRPCKTGGKWICGTAKRVHLNGTDGTTATYSVSCTQSAEKCIRDIADARRDH
jgi:hypothetical protein